MTSAVRAHERGVTPSTPSNVLDRLEHLRHKRRAGSDQGRAHRSGPDANRRVGRTEAAGGQRVVLELVPVVALPLTRGVLSPPTARGVLGARAPLEHKKRRGDEAYDHQLVDVFHGVLRCAMGPPRTLGPGLGRSTANENLWWNYSISVRAQRVSVNAIRVTWTSRHPRARCRSKVRLGLKTSSTVLARQKDTRRRPEFPISRRPGDATGLTSSAGPPPEGAQPNPTPPGRRCSQAEPRRRPRRSGAAAWPRRVCWVRRPARSSRCRRCLASAPSSFSRRRRTRSCPTPSRETSDRCPWPSGRRRWPCRFRPRSWPCTPASRDR